MHLQVGLEGRITSFSKRSNTLCLFFYAVADKEGTVTNLESVWGLWHSITNLLQAKDTRVCIGRSLLLIFFTNTLADPVEGTKYSKHGSVPLFTKYFWKWKAAGLTAM